MQVGTLCPLIAGTAHAHASQVAAEVERLVKQHVRGRLDDAARERRLHEAAVGVHVGDDGEAR
eukprot:1692449-Prymnesium_polylepis.1